MLRRQVWISIMTRRPPDTSSKRGRTAARSWLGCARGIVGERHFDFSESVREIPIAGLLSRNPGSAVRQAIHGVALREAGIDLPNAS
jgi:hypothetical protein